MRTASQPVIRPDLVVRNPKISRPVNVSIVPLLFAPSRPIMKRQIAFAHCKGLMRDPETRSQPCTCEAPFFLRLNSHFLTTGVKTISPSGLVTTTFHFDVFVAVGTKIVPSFGKGPAGRLAISPSALTTFVRTSGGKAETK